MTTYKKIKTIEVFGVKKQIYNKDKSKKDYVTYKGEKIELEKYKKIMLKLKKSKKSIKGGALIADDAKRKEVLDNIFKLIDGDNKNYINEQQEKINEQQEKLNKDATEFDVDNKEYIKYKNDIYTDKKINYDNGYIYMVDKKSNVEEDLNKIFLLLSLRGKYDKRAEFNTLFPVYYDEYLTHYKNLFDNN